MDVDRLYKSWHFVRSGWCRKKKVFTYRNVDMRPVVDLPTVLVRSDVLFRAAAGTVDVSHPVGRPAVLGVHKVAGPPFSANLTRREKCFALFCLYV